jgi:hypothetical protein
MGTAAAERRYRFTGHGSGATGVLMETLPPASPPSTSLRCQRFTAEHRSARTSLPRGPLLEASGPGRIGER